MQRQANQQLPSPADRKDVPELPLQYQWSYTNEQFLVFGSGQGDANRVFIFGPNQSLLLLSHSPNWFGDGKTGLVMGKLVRWWKNWFGDSKTGLVMEKLVWWWKSWFGDGTFKVCPQIFFQIYTIHTQINERILSCIYPLLPNKTEDIYTRLLQNLKDAFTISHQIYRSIFKTLVYRTTIRKIKTLCFLALYAFCTSFRTTKWCYTLFWITDRRNSDHFEDTYIGIFFIKFIKW